MNPQMLLQVIAQALAREQQARDQLELALAEQRDKVAALEAEVADLEVKIVEAKPKRAPRKAASPRARS